MYVERFDFTLQVNASGAATVYSDRLATGLVRAMRYVPDGSNPLDTGADLTITLETSGLPLITITNIGTGAVNFNPQAPTCGLTGTAALYAAAGSAVNALIPVAGERIKIVVAQGGVSMTGTFYIWVG